MGRNIQTTRADLAPKVRRVRDIAYVLRHRLRSVSLWRAIMAEHAGGLVSPAMAADILGVSREHIRRLVREGKLPAVEMPPEFGSRRLIPVDALIACGTRLEQGRPIEYPRNRRGRVVNPFAAWLDSRESAPVDKKT